LFSKTAARTAGPSWRGADVLGAVDDDEMAARIHEAPRRPCGTSRRDRDLARGLFVLEIALEMTGPRNQHLARSAILTFRCRARGPAVVGLASSLGCSDTRPVVSVEP